MNSQPDCNFIDWKQVSKLHKRRNENGEVFIFATYNCLHRIKCIFTHFLLILNFIYYRQFCYIPIEIYTKKEPLITDADVFINY